MIAGQSDIPLFRNKNYILSTYKTKYIINFILKYKNNMIQILIYKIVWLCFLQQISTYHISFRKENYIQHVRVIHLN